jgi:Ca2+-binding RTX toxin-like protein
MSDGLGFAHALGTVDGALRFGHGDDQVSLGDETLGGGGIVAGPILTGRGDDDVSTGTAEIGGLIALGAGHDTLDALAATSDLTVFGGSGDDNIQTGDGDDRIVAGGGDDAVFSGAGRDVVFGGPGDDAIDGGAGFDVLLGGAGDDQLFAAAGFDLVTGGAGADTFFFGPTSDVDVILDFSIAEGDVIDLSLFGLFASGTEAYAAGGDVGGDAVWDLGEGRTLTLADTDYADLSGDTFIV